MTLLAPLALLGLGLLAIPIFVHLFQPRHVRQTPFSSLRWLHLTQQRMARRIQLHQVLLFLLRAAFLSLLVFALARPIWSPSGQSAGLDRIVVLDVSRSMGRLVEGRPTPFDVARKTAGELVRHSLPGDRTAILLAGTSTTVLAPWTTEAALYLPALDTLTATLEETQLDSACEPIRSLLAQRRTGAAVEVVFLTDNPAAGWNTTQLSSFVQDVADEERVSWRLIDVSVPAPRNAWVTAARLRQSSAGPALHVEVEGVSDGPLNRTLRITGIKGVEPQDLAVTIQPGRKTRLEFPLPSTFEPAGSLAMLKLEPADDLPDDDVFYVNLKDNGGAPLLLITPITPLNAAHQPGLALETAILALAEAGSLAADGALQIRTPASLTTADITAAAIILLADVPGLPESLSVALTERVSSGAGLILFLGPTMEYETYNRGFRQPLNAAGSVLPAELGGTVTADSGGLSHWTRWNDRHPVLSGLVDPEIGDLAGTSSQTWYRFSGDFTSADEILATMSDGTPAMIDRRVGAGRVLIVNASADDRWCDLPRRKSFVPLVDRMLTHLQTGGYRRSWTIGEPVTLTLPQTFSADNSPRVIAPSGQAVATRRQVLGTQTWLTIIDPREAGFYRIEDPDGSSSDLSLVVQPGRGDSRLEAADLDQFRAWWSPLDIKREQPQATATTPAVSTDRRVALEPWLMALAGVCLLAEMFLVHWLCPRMNPAISVSHHRRRGFVAPLKEREAEREGAGVSS